MFFCLYCVIQFLKLNWRIVYFVWGRTSSSVVIQNKGCEKIQCVYTFFCVIICNFFQFQINLEWKQKKNSRLIITWKISIIFCNHLIKYCLHDTNLTSIIATLFSYGYLSLKKTYKILQFQRNWFVLFHMVFWC